ncbi:MAG: TadE/TadG family type IV pilus assembly protein [Blautia sp.]|jgi:hypothetical protein
MGDWMKYRKRSLWKGSFTVELALLMPLILLVVLGILSLSFFMHHKVWLTAAAYESAGMGASLEERQETAGVTAAKLRAEERYRDYFECDPGTNLKVSKNGEILQVCYTGKVQSVYGGLLWRIEAKGKCRIWRPAAFIRKVRLAEKAGSALEGH